MCRPGWSTKPFHNYNETSTRKSIRRCILRFFEHKSRAGLTIRNSIIFALPSFLLLGCNASPDGPINKFADPVILKISDLKDRRLSDSLYPYFNHENAIYRMEAVEAFASIQPTANIDRIGKLLLMDADAGVRKSAAFTLGQIRHASSERLLLGAVVKEKVPENISVILEAYGKVTSRWKLEPETFIDDSLESAGLALSLYRAGLREKTDHMANGVAKRLLASHFSLLTRLRAAHFFARGAKDFNDAIETLVTVAKKDPSPEVRMAAALALGKTADSGAALSALMSIIKDEKDPRVLVNAVRALKAFPFNRIEPVLYECLRHNEMHVAIAASEVIRDLVSEQSWINASSQTNHVTEWLVIANIYEGVLRAAQNESVAREIRQLYTTQQDPYVKAALLGSLKGYPAACEFVEAELRLADTAVIRSMAAATLVAMNYSEHFEPRYRARFAKIYSGIISSSDDPAVIGTLAGALADSALNYRELILDYRFLMGARSRLQLPAHIEAVQPLEAAIAYFEGREAPDVHNEFNHPIDWELVRKIPEGHLVTIRTSRGNIAMRLLVNEAPGSVANFLALAQEGYFDNKVFHRVVPNFVVQTGCNRGDGWGSEDYSIRSEFSQRQYTTGSVGMASAGKDTEGTQWFITHSPTPHLDGRYTLFGEVVNGMKVVDYLQQGDKIIDVDAGNLNAQ